MIFSATYYRTDKRSFDTEQIPRQNCSVFDIISTARKIDALPEISSLPGGASGHKGWITVMENENVLHTYFMDDVVDFELYLVPPIDGCDYCTGELTFGGLERVLTMIDTQKLTIQLLSKNAVSIDLSPRH